jgi:hypothetical protein
MGLASRGGAFGVAGGSALIGARRVHTGGGVQWVTSVEGPAATSAARAAGAAAPGQLLTAGRELERLGAGYTGSPIGEIGGETLYAVGTQSDPRESAGKHEVAFPTEFAELLPFLREEWEIQDLYLTRVLSGKSGARVLVVDIVCADFSGQAVLKLEMQDDHPRKAESEAARHERAIEADPEYAAAHLPKLVKFLSHGATTATLSTIAAGGLEYSSVWFHTPYEVQRDTAALVSLDILEGWNASYELAPGLVAPEEILRSWLSHRLDPGVSRIDKRLADQLGIDAREQTFLLNGSWYPNPLAFARGVTDAVDPPAIRAAVGRMHGDFHGHNVLTSQRRDDVADYFLIDLAYFDEANFLFLDHGYFELAYLLRAREDATIPRWLELLDGVFAEQAANADDIGVMAVVEAIRSGRALWVAAHEENRTSYMESQMLLGQVGAGLNYAHKRVAIHTSIQAFLYAAVALKEYVTLHELDWPRTGVVARPRT